MGESIQNYDLINDIGLSATKPIFRHNTKTFQRNSAEKS